MSGMDDKIPWICLKCGEYFLPPSYSIQGNCPSCQQKMMMTKMAYIYEMKRKNGWIPESRRKRGRRAYETRVAGYSITDPEKYKCIMQKMVSGGDVSRARRIKRKAKIKERERDGQIQND